MRIPPLKTVKAGATKHLKGVYNNAIIKPMARGMGKVANTKAFEKTLDFFHKTYKNEIIGPTLFMQTLASASMTVFTLQNIAKAKVDQERKPFLMIDSLLTFGVTTGAVVALDAKTKNIPKLFCKAYKRLMPNITEAELAKRQYSTEKMKSMFIFANIVRFAIPVLIVPIVGRVVNVFNKNKEKKAQAALLEQHALKGHGVRK